MMRSSHKPTSFVDEKGLSSFEGISTDFLGHRLLRYFMTKGHHDAFWPRYEVVMTFGSSERP